MSSVLQKTSSGDTHPAFVKAALAARGLTLTALARRHDKEPSYFRVALLKPFPKALRILARAIGCRPHQVWPTLFDERDRSIKARSAAGSTKKLPTNGRSRLQKAAA